MNHFMSSLRSRKNETFFGRLQNVWNLEKDSSCPGVVKSNFKFDCVVAYHFETLISCVSTLKQSSNNSVSIIFSDACIASRGYSPFVMRKKRIMALMAFTHSRDTQQLETSVAENQKEHWARKLLPLAPSAP